MSGSIKKIEDILDVNPSKMNILKGIYKLHRNKRAIKKYNFNEWHIKPSELSAYSQKTIRMINDISGIESKTVVEVGCGLGGIISKIDSQNRRAYDISKEVLDYARIINCGVVFSSEDVSEIEFSDVDVVIMIGFLHSFKQAEFETFISYPLKKGVKYFCIDKMYKDNLEMLDYKFIERLGYKVASKSIRFNEMKEVVLYEKE